MIYVKNEKLPIFKGRLSLCFAETAEEVQDYYDNEIFDDIRTAHGLATIFSWRNQNTFVLTIICPEGFKPTFGVISHESIHLAQFICTHIGYEPKEDSDEIYSHLCQYITDRYVAFLHKIGKLHLFLPTTEKDKD